ncbi:hypothetical protein ACU5EH_25520 [Aliivibrio salmonicida]|uniref:hypothetical protein n=1 Tax=Aliivibrio salmonicida TaxID=40269 RepID=UPI00406C976B
MKIDLDYMRKMLDVFIDNPKAVTTYEDLEKVGIKMSSVENPSKFDDTFIFHISLLVENGFISNMQLETHSLKAIGLQINYGHDGYSSTDMRLTNKGIDFAHLLNQSEVFENLKANFKSAPFEIMLSAGKELASGFMKKKVKEILE